MQALLVQHIINNTQDSVINVDKLTYAGNLESLLSVSGSDRYCFEQADISKAQQLLGYQPSHKISEGLDEAMGWYVKTLK